MIVQFISNEFTHPPISYTQLKVKITQEVSTLEILDVFKERKEKRKENKTNKPDMAAGSFFSFAMLLDPVGPTDGPTDGYDLL